MRYEKPGYTVGLTDPQIIGFLREAEAGMPIKDLCRRHGFSE
ncbi:transposase, partial [Xanthomonas oryzae]